MILTQGYELQPMDIGKVTHQVETSTVQLFRTLLLQTKASFLIQCILSLITMPSLFIIFLYPPICTAIDNHTKLQTHIWYLFLFLGISFAACEVQNIRSLTCSSIRRGISVTELSWKESQLILFVVLFESIMELLTRKPHCQIFEYFVPKILPTFGICIHIMISCIADAMSH